MQVALQPLRPTFGKHGGLFVNKPETRRLERFCEGAAHVQDAALGGAVVLGSCSAVALGMYLPPATWITAGLVAIGLLTFSETTRAFNRQVAARPNTVASPFHPLSFVAGIVLPLALSGAGIFGIQQAFRVSDPIPSVSLRVVTCVDGQKPPAPASLTLLKRRGVKLINCSAPRL